MEVIAVLSESIFAGFVATGIISLFVDLSKPSLAHIKKYSCWLLLGASASYLLTFIISLLVEIGSDTPSYDSQSPLNRLTSPFWWAYSLEIICKGIIPQVLYFRRDKRSMFTVAMFLSVGIFIENIIHWLTSFMPDYIPSGWSGGFVFLFLDILLSLVLYVILLLVFITIRERGIPYLRKNID